MDYVGNIFRPPSEASSLILQVTVGCTHNKCTFCSMYKDKKFRIKPIETVLNDLQGARRRYSRVDRVFLADGDALCLTTDKLMVILNAIRETFPECERVGIYSRATHILSKTPEELAQLAKAGIGIAYIGAESGSDEVLLRIDKGETAAQITKAVKMAEAAGIQASVTFISGLGGKELLKEHATKTGKMISEMGASYVGFLSLVLTPGVPLYADVQSGKFELITPFELMEELEIILEHSNCKKETVLRSNHASNWLALKGNLPHDKNRLLDQVRRAKTDKGLLRAGGQRQL